MAIISKLYSQLGEHNWHNISCIPIEQHITLNHKYKLAIVKVMRNTRGA